MALTDHIAADKILELLSRGGTVLTDRRLRQIADEGFFPAPVRGSYALADTLVGLVKYYRESRHREGDNMTAERLRKITEEADKLALENEKTRGGLVEIEAVYKHFEGIFIALRARILGSGLSDVEKDELLNDLRRIKAGDIAKSARDRTDSSTPVRDTDSTSTT